MNLSREQRRQELAEVVKRLGLTEKMRALPSYLWPTQRPAQVWASKTHMVQAYNDGTGAVLRLTVNRLERGADGQWLDGITWDELQRIKSECGFGHMEAVEFYPADADVVNVSNMRHLWILEPGTLSFGWRRK